MHQVRGARAVGPSRVRARMAGHGRWRSPDTFHPFAVSVSRSS